MPELVVTLLFDLIFAAAEQYSKMYFTLNFIILCRVNNYVLTITKILESEK